MSTRLIIILSPAFRRWCLAAPIQFTRDGVGHVAELLLLLLKVLRRGRGAVFLKPFRGFLDGVKELEQLSVHVHGQVGIVGPLTVSLSSSSILPPRPSSSLAWFFKLKA